MNFRRTLVAAAIALSSASALADTIVLDFEDIASTYPHSNSTFVLDYYNGGTSSAGTSGTNHGVQIGDNGLVICLNTTTVFCSNTSRGGLAPTSALGGLFFLNGSETFMNVAAGFDTGFSFNYASTTFNGSVQVYDDLNGTGNLLATVSLSPNASGCSSYSAGFCPFGAAGVAFNGIAKSVSFGGVANQIVFDDITFGSVTPGGTVPEPAAIGLLALALGGAAALGRRRVER